MSRRKVFKRIGYTAVIIILLVNIIAFNHAWHFTHYDDERKPRVKYETVGLGDKIKYGFWGVPNPRPYARYQPDALYQVVHINSNVQLTCWMMSVDSAKGTVLMFHGYKGEKSQLLTRAAMIREMGYNTMLVDMMGAGESEGNQVTIGFKEAENVKDCYNYLVNKGAKNIIIYGISMGAAASMKAIQDYQINPNKLILEAPFGSLYKAVTNRFDLVNAPYFPMAQLVVFWGGIQYGFWGFGHAPVAYAKHISCPTLLMYGAKDKRVMRSEIDEIANNLQGKKAVAIYEQSGHVNFLYHNKEEWREDLSTFLSQ